MSGRTPGPVVRFVRLACGSWNRHQRIVLWLAIGAAFVGGSWLVANPHRHLDFGGLLLCWVIGGVWWSLIVEYRR